MRRPDQTLLTEGSALNAATTVSLLELSVRVASLEARLDDEPFNEDSARAAVNLDFEKLVDRIEDRFLADLTARKRQAERRERQRVEARQSSCLIA